MAEIIDVVMRMVDGVTTPLRNIRQHMEATGKSTERLGREISRTGRSVTAMGESLLPLAAGITTIGAIGTKTFMDFDATLTAAGVKAGATTEELEKMREKAAQIGAEFPVTARDAAAGMDRLAASGFNATQIIGMLPGIVEASIASGEDMALTSDIVSSSLSIWKMTTGDVAANTAHMADVIQAAANASKLSMADFGLAVQYAGAPAAALGVSVEELSTAMGIMANNGIQASTIGTSLRSTLSRLASPPKAAADAIEALGLAIKDSSGNFVGLENVINQMRDAMQGMSNTEQVAYLKAIAGEEAYSGLLALIQTAPEDYKRMTETITNSSGSSHEAYMKMQDTLKGSIDSMLSAVEALGIAIGQRLAPMIQNVAGIIRDAATWFKDLPTAMQDIFISGGLAVVGLTGFLLVAGKLITVAGSLVTVYGQIGRVLHGGTIANKALMYGVQGVVKAFGFLKAGSAALLGPIGLVVAAVAVAAYLIYSRWDKFAPFFKDLWERVTTAFQAAKDKVMEAVQKVTDTWNRAMEQFGGSDAVMERVGQVLTFIGDIMSTSVYAAVVVLGSALTGILTTAFTVVGNIVSSAITIFGGLIDFITGVFTGNWSQAWEGIVTIFEGIFGGITAIADGVIAGVKAAINSLISGVNNMHFSVPEWVPGVGGSSFGPLNFPMLYKGTDNWIGGPAMVHDRGAEIINLPQGSQVIPHDDSLRNAERLGASRAGAFSGGITVNISGVTMNGSNDIKELGRKVAEEIYYQMNKNAVNMNVGAI